MHPPADPLALLPARVHEVAGPGRRSFALCQAARHAGGPLIWIMAAHRPESLIPAGLPEGVAARLVMVRPGDETGILWAMEESLRARAAALVVAEPERPLSLTAGRRLQLAAEAGGTTGLVLLREEGSNAAETRWDCAAEPSPLPPPGETGSTWHRWALIKNKKGTLGAWRVDWDGSSSAVDLVSAFAERDGPAPPPG
ncbi:MAG: hypothetical protein IT542_08270 [Rubellimicrobium sp.]|nr:hypothetical protein [Rubellimicrobium sp.]